MIVFEDYLSAFFLEHFDRGYYAFNWRKKKRMFCPNASCMALSIASSSKYFVWGGKFLLVHSRFYQNCFYFLHIHKISKTLNSFVFYKFCLPMFQEAVQVLLKHSADVNARDKNWQTPLHIAAANKAVKCAEALVPLLSNVNVSDRAGRTALHHAAFSGHGEVGDIQSDSPCALPLPPPSPQLLMNLPFLAFISPL